MKSRPGRISEARANFHRRLPAAKGESMIRAWKLIVPASLLLLAPGILCAQELATPCETGNALRAGARLECVSDEQLERILSFPHPAPNQRLRRQALTIAFEVSACLNNFRLLPTDQQQQTDYHYLQQELLDFYQQVSEDPGVEGLRFQDQLAWSSLRIHYCMIDENLPLSGCMTHIEEALKDFQAAFQSANKSRSPAPPDSADEFPAAGVEALPDFQHVESFVDLSLENTRRFPLALGKQVGETLGSVLCDAFDLYPERRTDIALLYNVLIRFDVGNMASSRQLYQFLEDLGEFFRPARRLPSFLYLSPADWSPSPPPCSEEDWVLVFPEFRLFPGYLLPGRARMGRSLEHLETMLVRSAEFAENPNHLWKPFHRYGMLLFRLAQSVKVAAYRDPEMWQTRHLIMGKARDALLLKGVWHARHPIDPKPIRGSVDELLHSYTGELLADLRLDTLIDFSEQSLNAGPVLLSPEQKQFLHRQLAIANSLLGERSKALSHLQESDIQQTRLREIRATLKESGVSPGMLQPPPDHQ